MLHSDGLYMREGKRIYIKQPILEELEFVASLWSDEETMKDIGGIFSFPRSKWEGFYKKMVYPSDGKNFYCLVYLNDGSPIGEVSFHGYDSATKVARFNIKILSKYRNQGFGEEAVKLLLEYFFIEFGGEIIMDNISTEAGVRLAEKTKFTIIYNQKGNASVRISKDEFLEKKEESIKNVGFIMHDEMNILDFTLAKEIFMLSNKIEKKELFKLHEIEASFISGNKEVKEKIDILFIPDGNNLDNSTLEDLYTKFHCCDYVCIKTDKFKLNECHEERKFFRDRKGYESISKNFVDNGKIMISYNLLGEIEMLLGMITKVYGRRLSNNIAKKLGYNSTV